MNRKTLGIMILISLCVLISIMAFTGNAFSAREYQALPGNGFTYQGQLKQNGLPTDNTCDFRFSLWEASSSGSQVGDVQFAGNIDVSDGYFSIPSLDFGNNAFNGEARWLEIEVKCVGETVYTALNPRQPISPAPYALALPGLFTQQNETSPNVIGGYHGNLVSEGVYGAAIGGGGAQSSFNQVTDHYGTVAGGSDNQAGDDDAAFDDSLYAAVGGGESNTASGDHALVAGGEKNSASASYTSIGGGNNNTADNAYSTISGGHGNLASGVGSFVGGGGNDGIINDGNQAFGNASTIIGGMGNTTSITGTYAVIGGGLDNIVDGSASTVGGGESNSAGNSYATVSGGNNNDAQGGAAVIGGGESNNASGQYATIGGGHSNNTNGDYSTIPGGLDAETTLFGQTAYSSGSFSQSGDAQYSTYILRNVTSDAAATELFLDGASARLTLTNDRTLAFEIYIVARRDAYVHSAGYIFRGLIKNDGGETKFVGSPSMVTLGEDNPAWNVTLTASDAYDALIIQVSGAENATIRWVATVRAVEVAW